jgi:starch synthase (maltosyl-transferring)
MRSGKEDPVQIGQTDADGRRRVVIEAVTPEIDGGRFPVRRVVGEKVTVRADVFGDGHDELAALLLYRHESELQWHKAPMRQLPNDRWEAGFTVSELGSYRYSLEGRIDHFATWKKDLVKRFEAGQDLEVDREIGARLIEAAAERAGTLDGPELREWAEGIRAAADDPRALGLAREEALAELMARNYDPALSTSYGRGLLVTVERQKALFSAWYELFPRSCRAGEVGHGSFRECERLLPEIARMGFDVLYFPPIHPIGRTNRKGKNNATAAEAEDPGSPWAIGAAEGGHTDIHPRLGTLEDFRRFVARAAELGIETALDIAFQCSPDHPWVRQHPDWFRWRPDGTVQYAENPPKKYEDIIPFDFETREWQKLWEELKEVICFWIAQGVRIFRVDNPHTKPFAFWEYAIGEIRKDYPDAIFLSEAFTRPKVMYRLAKAGFSQSYTYFSWRNTRAEMEQYLRELTGYPAREFFRPNFWPNTPDILPEVLQYGGRPAFVIRFLLAATLSASYGIYGPPFELFVSEALSGKEEYLDSEKYEIRCWDWENPDHMRELIARVNRIRRENPALQTNWNVHFCRSDNDNLISYVKTDAGRDNIILVAVSMDPFSPQAGHVRLPMEELGLEAGHPFLLHDLIGDTRNLWHQEWNRVELDLHEVPGRIWRLRPRLRREHDFDYFM